MSSSWKIKLHGHTATVRVDDIAPSGFTGSITSDEYGMAPITNCKRDGKRYRGDVYLNGVAARIDATVVDDGSVVGTVRIGWFICVDFVGQPIV